MHTLFTRMAWMATLLLSLSGCNNDKDKETPQPESPTLNKQITFKLYTETDYSDARWHDSKMRLTLSLKRVVRNPHKETVVLDTTIGWMAFKDLPKQAAAAQFVKRLSEVSRQQEDVVVSITKLVSINGYETVFSHDLTLQPDKEQEVVEVKL